ncbi:hypothetical protein BD309DRAFT_945951 [Dichomitus squalens]|nr:hypothetical protein BD309DRAFT_945951 [Dichomitus squalens]
MVGARTMRMKGRRSRLLLLSLSIRHKGSGRAVARQPTRLPRVPRKGRQGEKQRASVQVSIPEVWKNSGLLSLVIRNGTRGGEGIRE